MKTLESAYKTECYLGFLWIVCGICSLFNSAIADVVALVLLFGMVVVMGIVAHETKKMDETQYDEMALQHTIEAKAYALDILYKVIMIVPLFELLRLIPDCSIRLGSISVYRFVLGISEIAKGFKFLQLERDGDVE